jgi:hypothetical protein
MICLDDWKGLGLTALAQEKGGGEVRLFLPLFYNIGKTSATMLQII